MPCGSYVCLATIPGSSFSFVVVAGVFNILRIQETKPAKLYAEFTSTSAPTLLSVCYWFILHRQHA